MNENTSRTSTRWGASVTKSLDGGQTVDIAQFCDVKLLAAQQLAIALYAVASAPVAGISVVWRVSLGNGSVDIREIFAVPVTDEENQSPLIIVRPAKTVLISAQIISAAAPLKNVRVSAFVAPVSPTWLTDLNCEQAAT